MIRYGVAWYGVVCYVTAALAPHLAVGAAVDELSLASLAVGSGQNALAEHGEKTPTQEKKIRVRRQEGRGKQNENTETAGVAVNQREP